MKQLILKSLFLIIFVACNTSVFAQAEYDSLPNLDGKVDTGPANVKNLIKEDQPVKESGSDLTEKYGNTVNESKQKVSAANESAPKKDSIVTFDSPQLDKLTPSLKKSHRNEAFQFAVYEKDLNKMLFQLIHLKNTIKEGTSIQLFSARVTTTKFMNDSFKSKYEGSYESQLESYRLVQKIVDSADYVRNYWLNSNKVYYNQHDVPDEIVQTKFLVITTAVEKLEQLIEMETVLTQE